MAKAKKEKEAISFEGVLMNCRNALRGVGSTEKNRDAVISLVFLKFAGDKFEKQRAKLLADSEVDSDLIEEPAAYLQDSVFYLKESARWSYLVANASANTIAVSLDQALFDIEKSNVPLKGALPQGLFVSLNASKESIKSLIDEVNKLDKRSFHEEDLVGRVYEYFLRAYAAAGTKEDGEFYTPACVVKLIAELVEPFAGVVYDPCCGSGGMFVQSMKFVESHRGDKLNISILGQELNPDTWRLCKMNLAIRGIFHNLGEKNASTFTNDLHPNRKVDYIMANPPFNFKGWRGEDELLDDPRFRGFSALPSTSNANYAWILHMRSKLHAERGVAGFLLANGALNSDGVDYEIRKDLLEKDQVEAIIVLPRDMFYTTDISVTLWILNMNKRARKDERKNLRDRSEEVLFMDLRRWDQNVEEISFDKNKRKKKTALTDAQIDEIKKIFDAWRSPEKDAYRDVPELCKSATLEQIRKQDYSLAPSKYVEFLDRDLAIDFEKEMTRIQREMKNILREEKEAQIMLADAFKGIGYGIE